MAALRGMLSGLWTYAKARRRMIGRCPPHRYMNDTGDVEFEFCLDCGEYPEPDLSRRPQARRG